MRPQIGDRITCKIEMAAFGSDYGPNKGRHITFKPGMVGVVRSIAPKVVRLRKGVVIEGLDRCGHFAVVDFEDEQGGPWRVGLDFCNIRRIRKTNNR